MLWCDSCRGLIASRTWRNPGQFVCITLLRTGAGLVCKLDSMLRNNLPTPEDGLGGAISIGGLAP